LPTQDHRLWKHQEEEGMAQISADPAQARMDKIERFKRQKATNERIKVRHARPYANQHA
jgi:hypothetical protein